MPTTREHSGRGRKLVGKRKYSSRPRRRQPPTRGAMRRTTARGAYGNTAKKVMMRRRSPFTETKVKSHEDVISQFGGLTDRTVYRTYNSELSNMNPLTFIAWKQGLQHNECVGNSVFLKYLKLKLSVRFPQPGFVTGSNTKRMPFVPQRYELIWGFVPAPLQYTGTTTPTVDTASIVDISTHINSRVLDYVNQQKDKLRFIPKKSSTIRIIGRRKVRPDLRYNSTAPATSSDNVGDDTAVGTIPNFDTSISWPMMKKVHLEKSTQMSQPSPGMYEEGLYGGNFSWLPFAVFVNWDWDDLPQTQRDLYCPALAWNDQVWYGDS